MKKIILILLLLFIPISVWGACTGSSPTWTSTADYASVNECVGSASVGDTINVSAGSATWSSTLTIAKGINLIGAGSASTIITTTANPGIAYTPPVGAADNPFRLSGFRFNKATGDNEPILQWGNDQNEATTVGNNKLTKGRVDHCIFNATSTVSPLVWLYPGTYGVFDNNTFNAYDYAFRATEGGDWTGAGWTYWGWTPGTSDAVYIENNTFNFAASVDNVGTSSQGSHRWVFRYNTFNVNSSSYSFFDAHGNQPSYFGAVQISNIYGNLFNAGSNNGQVHGQRGGQSFVFFNDWKTTGGNPTFKVQEEYADSNGNGPANNAITGQPQHVYNSYYFNNRINTTGDLIDTVIDDWVGEIPAENVDIWNQTNWVSNGSAGVGCGTLANRPACVSGCATGVGYWATDQSCSNLTDYVGASPTTPISGTLYRWSGSEWVSYYTPYTYPHPLRGESADETAPTVTITTSSGTIYSSSSTVTGTASDAVGVSSCKWRLTSEPDANNGTSCTGTTSWSCSVTGMSSGANTVYVECGDAAANWSTGNSITLTVSAPPEGGIPQATLGAGAAATIGTGAAATLY